jgi:hypothetical protein
MHWTPTNFGGRSLEISKILDAMPVHCESARCADRVNLIGTAASANQRRESCGGPITPSFETVTR